MTCEDFDSVLAGLLEGELDPGVRAVAECHATACKRCGPLLADLVALRTEAARLPVLKPARDLWSGIAVRIGPPVELSAVPREVRHQRVRLAAAAVLLVAAVATATWIVARTAAVPFATEPAAAALAQAERAESTVALAHLAAAYDREIAELRAMLAERSPAVDPETRRVIDENLRIIDEAIANSRAALAEIPASAFLARHLARAYDQQLDALRRLATISAE